MPVVVFSFSKKKCGEIADMLSSLTLTDAREQSEIHVFCANTVKRLQHQDARLPQVLKVQEMLKRGIGVHHGGLLPILKEMVEMLFSRGLVKVLFATETFAMGVNMPARTVVFNGTRKHDGRDFRDLLPGEYTQMAGRAGRRGLDKVGTVVHTCWGLDSIKSLPSLKTMLTGKATMLESQFRLKYNMILNLLRVEDMSVEDMIKRSFSEFATQRELGARNLPKMLEKATARLERLTERAVSVPCIRGEPAIEEYLSISKSIGALNKSLMRGKGRALLSPGRLIVVTVKQFIHAPAVVLKLPKAEEKDRGSSLLGHQRAQAHTQAASSEDQVLVLLLCPVGFVASKEPDADAAAASGGSDFSMAEFGMTRRGGRRAADALKEGTFGQAGGRTYAVAMAPMECLVLTGKKRVQLNQEAVIQNGEKGALANLIKALEQVEQQLPSESHPADEFATVDIIKELKINDYDMSMQANELGHLLDIHSTSKCASCPRLTEQYEAEATRNKLQERIDALRHVLSNESLSLFPDFQQRLMVLRGLGYVDEVDTVQLKGRVACEVNTCDELIATEMVFENVLAPLNAPEIAGVLSALVFQEKSDNQPKMTANLGEASKKMQSIARSLGKLQQQCGLPTDAETNCKLSLNFGIADLVYEWARGVPFEEITQMTLVEEGTIVRTITRLDELCREVRNSARVIGNATLYRSMEEASALIRRDIVFCQSIYVSG
ncbi:unnamed protein product [Chrysoparadoxa australica]